MSETRADAAARLGVVAVGLRVKSRPGQVYEEEDEREEDRLHGVVVEIGEWAFSRRRGQRVMVRLSDGWTKTCSMTAFWDQWERDA